MNGRFGQLKVKHSNGIEMELLEDLRYTFPNRITYIDVPAGFVTDGASIKILRNVGLFVLHSMLVGHGLAAHVLHDYLYFTQPKDYDRKRTDLLYRQALRASGVSRWRAALYYYGVRMGGWVAWNNHKKRLKK